MRNECEHSNFLQLYSSAQGGEVQLLLDSDASGPKWQSTTNTSRPINVAIILGYFNGRAFIEEQLNSIFNQSLKDHHVFVCDDQSAQPFAIDELKLDDNKLSKLSVVTNPQNLGYVNNFLNTLKAVGDKFDYYAFSDQDDIWNEDKLRKSVEALKAAPVDTPALYCARTEIVDASANRSLGFSPVFGKPPSFANALIQNIGGGNTMVFNRSARDLIINVVHDTPVISHDWWSYQMVTGAGGYVIYDPEPCLKYRQHTHNLVGANTRWCSRLSRIRKLFRGGFRTWNDVNLRALADHAHLLTDENLRILNDVIAARQSSLIKRLFLFKRSGIHRQTFFSNLGLILGILWNKI